ncbi:uncharacterized protein LOC142568143 isoform X2 [Dermacentor variabilis]|uniref:uncharacterized protein LOC142568143 isoform X2 n=1 Tax=Dermacentor variabilis TaxID=34621 RepID=UPI003F5C76EC
MAVAVFLAVAVGAIENVLANQKHFDITIGLPKNAICKSFIHANEACRKAVEPLDVHRQSVNGTKMAMKHGTFAQVLKMCYRRKLAKDDLHHVCRSERTVRKVLQCYKKASTKATPKTSRKATKEIFREYRKCFLEKFTPEPDPSDEEIMFPRAPILRD